MKFFVRQLPNGRVLVKNTDFASMIQPQIFSNMQEAANFMQQTIDRYGAGAVSIEDPTGIEAILGIDGKDD